MAFRPAKQESARPSSKAITEQMVGIGMQFAGNAASQPSIEETLIYASEAAMVGDDLRVMSILVAWLEVHQTYVHADRLIRLAIHHPAEHVRAFWAAVGAWLRNDRRFRRLEKGYNGPQIDLLSVGTDFQMDRHGEDVRFVDTALRVAANVLRTRASDVLRPAALAARHSGYRNRVLMGPTWRADVWTELQANRDLTASQAARRVGCAFATAWHAKRDFDLLAETQESHDVQARASAASASR